MLLFNENVNLLDWGCGYGAIADKIRDHVNHIYLYDISKNITNILKI